MYGQSTVLIAGLLLVSASAAIEVGYRLGFASRRRQGEPVKSATDGVQNSLLGLLALLLAFTFSLALQRYNGRSDAVVKEAAAIRTAYLRAQLLPESVRGEVEQHLREYVDVRLQTARVSTDHAAEVDALHARSDRIFEALWQLARRIVEDHPRSSTSGLFVQGLNGLATAYVERDASLDRHVPEVVLLLLFAVFLVAASVLGYNASLGGHRPPVVSYIMVAMIVIVVFVIVDLDRPRRGLIQVDKQSLLDVHTSMHAGHERGTGGASPAVAPGP